ncbi:TPA: hypothetical protein L4U31_002866 [Pseudomonas aeruginosa]|nr:hypothetical protein [Pseudomonas aeruginosa]
MAVLLGQLVQSCAGGVLANPLLTGDHWHFDWVNQFDPVPFGCDTLRPGHGTLVTHWPVEANGRAITGQRMRAFVDDWYYRVHISPQQLDLGNIVSAQSTPIYVWNAWFVPRTLLDVDGLDEGIIVTGQPDPPLLFNPLQELLWQLTVTPNGAPVLDTIVAWEFDNGSTAGVRVTANRIIAWAFVPDWGDGVLELLSWSTDILQSETAKEQRRSLRQTPRREFEAHVYVEGRERQLLDLALHGWSARTWALPLWHEIQLLHIGIPSGAMFIPCATVALDFTEPGLAMLRGESAFISETVEVAEIRSDGLLLKRGTQQAWGPGTRLYPARSAQLQEEPQLTRLTDTLISADVRFLIVEQSHWPAAMPMATYRGWPVYDQRPDESEDLTHTLARLLLTLDNGTSTPLYTDTANRGLVVRGHRWIDLGRAARAVLRSFLYALRGRWSAVWIPTHADDLTLVDVVTSVATSMNIAACGYTRFSNGAPGKRDIRIELTDGTVLHRRITGSAELTPEIEVVNIDTALGRQVAPSDVARICWMNLMRLDSDVQKLEHITDSEGVATWSTVWREVRDES